MTTGDGSTAGRRTSIGGKRAWRSLAVLVALLGLPLGVAAQPPARPARVGILALGVGPAAPLADSLRQGLRDHGYVEGRNIAILYRYAEGRPDRLPALAAELVGLRVDVIITESNVAALAARRATTTIPIVMAIAGDPVRAGVVRSLARPGGNVTGLTLIHPELSGKRLQLLKEVVPGIALVTVVWNPDDPAAVDFLRETEAAARSLHLRLHAVEARSAAELDGALRAVREARPSAFYTLGGGMFYDNRRRLVDFAVAHRLPGVFPTGAFVEAGGLMSYGPDLAATARRAAVFVDRLLKGERPADLPIERPTTFELVLNLRTARALGLVIPASVVARADRVLE